MSMASHYHSCPECYEHVSCTMKCTIEYDLQDGDREFGAHCVCDFCRSRTPDQDWFLKYNGFIK